MPREPKPPRKSFKETCNENLLKVEMTRAIEGSWEIIVQPSTGVWRDWTRNNTVRKRRADLVAQLQVLGAGDGE
jgi:hypothetical protein